MLEAAARGGTQRGQRWRRAALGRNEQLEGSGQFARLERFAVPNRELRRVAKGGYLAFKSWQFVEWDGGIFLWQFDEGLQTDPDMLTLLAVDLQASQVPPVACDAGSTFQLKYSRDLTFTPDLS
jgi:hypothetical protein